jgi:pimeloyl-ACP methyl ester carboxylesterase
MLLAMAMALSAVASASPAHAQVELCEPGKRTCALTVPLDRAGGVPGEVQLHVERLISRRPVDPPLFLLAGGPGQSAVRAFPRAVLREIFGPVLQRRDLVVLDQRGTGRSGMLACPALEHADEARLQAAVEECAGLLGPARSSYTTADSVDDIDAVRRALGYERIALLGVSYGTKVALSYAGAHPERIDRLVLDSVVAADGPDPLYRESFAATPRVLRELCRGTCRGITADPVGDLQRLVGMLGDGPLRGYIIKPSGRRVRAELSRFDLFATLAAGDLRTTVRSRFPAAVRSAVRGDTAPLLRLRDFAHQQVPANPRDFSAATYLATVCEESDLPWEHGTPAAQRASQARARVHALPVAAFAPFDAETALGSDALRLCEHWPAPRRSSTPRPALPDVPVLVLAGGQDVRTPAEVAWSVAAKFPRAQTITVSGLGHSVAGTDMSGCALRATRRFLNRRPFSRNCPRSNQIRPTHLDPRTLAQVPAARGTRGRAGRTVTAVRRSYQDALRPFFDLLLEVAASKPGAVASFRYAAGGLRSGSYAFKGDRVDLRGLEYVPGVRVSGRLRSVSMLPGGRLRVRGPAAARGNLRVRNGVMSGRLGGRRVRASLGPDLFDLVFGMMSTRALPTVQASIKPR